MTKGQKNTLLLPSALGYGNNPPPGIPKNAVLIFDVKLVDF
jgi:FKBP-type peptidyl-prolyl cis-trans isomerase